MRKLKEFKRCIPSAKSALNQEVDTTISTLAVNEANDLRNSTSDYFVTGFIIEPFINHVFHKRSLNPKFWEQFIDE